MINYTDDYMGKVAVVTGAARGIGKETATRISKNGAKVALWDYDEKNIQLLSEKIGNNSIPLKVDVSDENSVKNAAEIVRDKLGTPSLLVNCAGVAGDNATVADTDPNEWRRVININLTGTFLCCRELVSGMVNNNYGRIVNIASISFFINLYAGLLTLEEVESKTSISLVFRYKKPFFYNCINKLSEFRSQVIHTI